MRLWIVILIAFFIPGCIERPQFDDQQQKQVWTQKKITQYFVKKHVANPAEQALLISHNSKYPAIAAAQAVIESRVRPAAVGARKERGCYQVREKYWGKVSKRMDRQTQQHSVILAALLEENDGHVKKAIRAYNGSGSRAVQYEKLVAQNIAEIWEGDYAPRY